MARGWTLIAISFLLIAIGVGNGPDFMFLDERGWLLTLFSAGLFQIGLLLTLVGTIVRAIRFLPGDERKLPGD
jgi:hypothetical protein